MTRNKTSAKTRSEPHEPQLAYLNPEFMASPQARTLRIAAEYLDPQVRLKKAGVQNTVVFFGSARVLPRSIAEQRWRELERRGHGQSARSVSGELEKAWMAVEMSRYYEEARELARLITKWSLSLRQGKHYLVVCSGGGPGIMEAANRGAREAGGLSIGLNIKLPLEQKSNPYVTPELNFLFKYFFMRKLWFAQPARALIVFPGGFGTMDELWEFLTLLQTGKMGHSASILIYGSEFWKQVVNFDWLVKAGTIAAEDLKLFQMVDTPQEAFQVLKQKLRQNKLMRAAFRHPFP